MVVRRGSAAERGRLGAPSARAAGFRAAGRAVAGIQRRKRPGQELEASATASGAAVPGARARLGEDRPAVVLIDEIDKADPDVPNDLLVPFGSLTFEVTETHESVTAPLSRRPLLVLTTNEERDLPPAFLRRCVVLKLHAPNQDRLVSIGRAHFPDADEARLQPDRGAVRCCAGQARQDPGRRDRRWPPSPPRSGRRDRRCGRRDARRRRSRPIASTAEYLDAVQASLDLG